ncbi:helix-turn-helix transcriptional regulator [Paenibacillus ihumii]|uniref:helix-turn-helix transcriptional regulator n=1 Tax=Paenibacillus ihumii TaxID=687436 RepID=UPI0006D7AD8E|nr:helix-turn-helix transcriptional regulator [Paenibacillus ihumii]
MKNHIHSKRKELGLSQLELAERVGVTRQTINAVENNKYDPSLKLAMNIAKVLQVTVEELFFE